MGPNLPKFGIFGHFIESASLYSYYYIMLDSNDIEQIQVVSAVEKIETDFELSPNSFFRLF
jgi:hypothetical protein